MNDIPGLLSYSKIASTPTIPTNFNHLSGTISYSSITRTPSIASAATFSSIHPVDTWRVTSDGVNLVNYINNGSTIYASPGETSFIWRDDNDADIMRLKNNVTLGIVVSLSDARLHVGYGGAKTALIIQTYFDTGTGTALNGPQNRETADVCAILNSSVWCKSHFTSSRDIRIK